MLSIPTILVQIKSRAAVILQGGRDNFCCGLGARAVRAGSIGRDTHGPGERTELPPEEAGGFSPRSIHAEITAL